MEPTAAERARSQPEDLTAPPEWVAAQPELAAETGLAVLLVAGPQPPQLTIINNNTICQTFQSSPTHAHLCQPDCGAAFDRAQAAGTLTHYRCHAGLHCFAMPVELDAPRPLAVIGGRAFLAATDYRALLERFRTGDLRALAAPDTFHNIIFASAQELTTHAARVSELAAAIAHRPASGPLGLPAAATQGTTAAGVDEQGTGLAPTSLRVFPPHAKLRDAARLAVQQVSQTQQLTSVALVLDTEQGFVQLHATGKFKPGALPADLRRSGDIGAGGRRAGQLVLAGGAQAELFPLVVNDEVKGALLVGDVPLDAAVRQAVTEFCRQIALPLEVLRLREQLAQRTQVATHLRAFIESVSAIEPAEVYQAILSHCAELLRAERGSLLLFDEAANELHVRAATGPRATHAQEARVHLGDTIAGAVWRAGRPLVVQDMTVSGHRPAPAERKYKSGSFISYPIRLGARNVGLLNMTDKAGGGTYDELDLSLLEMLVPQLALALDRAEWHQKATQFQLLSITDPLTGLVNRRYLEERLSEELGRTKRHRFAMSFLMIDIDNFKDYNDRHGHPAGDLALEMAAQCLKSALRSADVAARYGGEEFSVLLPQTTIAEAQVIAERIRRRVERTQFPHGKAQPLGAVTVSIGISAYSPDLNTPAQIISAADHALYVAKVQGKNRVETNDPQPAADAPASPPAAAADPDDHDGH